MSIITHTPMDGTMSSKTHDPYKGVYRGVPFSYNQDSDTYDCVHIEGSCSSFEILRKKIDVLLDRYANYA